MSFAPGKHIGPYEISAPLGAGGMGEVYRAKDPRIGRDVALKVLPESFAQDADRLRRFEQEARATGQLNHPNILAVFDVGALDGAPYVVSELLEGDTLRERIGDTALPVRKAIDFATQIARGLAAAHEKGVVHRDLKPDNVFVTRDGRVKILDFGLAKLVGGEILTEADTHTAGVAGTDAGKVLGTVGYMSPEQVRAQPVDHRSDIFSFGSVLYESFGSVLYEMLSGRRAFRRASNVETMNAILKEDPPELTETNRHLPPALERIVSHCLEKNPEERFQSARDIAFDLEQLSGSAMHAGLPSAAKKARPWQRGAVAAIAALACATLGYWAGPLAAPSQPSSLSSRSRSRTASSTTPDSPMGRPSSIRRNGQARTRASTSLSKAAPSPGASGCGAIGSGESPGAASFSSGASWAGAARWLRRPWVAVRHATCSRTSRARTGDLTGRRSRSCATPAPPRASSSRSGSRSSSRSL